VAPRHRDHRRGPARTDPLGEHKLSDGVTWLGLASLSVLAGLGFTMSLFIAQLAFEHGTKLAQSKAAILCASTLAAIVGLAMIRVVAARGA
jgi:NhaA family Na+:H+ antiporter